MTASAIQPMNQPRRQSLGEELINAISHGLGAALGVAGLVLLDWKAISYGNTNNLVSVTIFGVSMILLYLISCLYHALPVSRGKEVFQVLDHCSIFLLIVGTYAPIFLVTVGGKLGWTIFLLDAACGVVGIVLNAIDLQRWKKVSLILYIAMGWMGVLALPSMLRNLSKSGFLLLLLGGVAYTVGVVFYRNKEKKYWHGIWHLFVLLGTVLQFFAIYTNCCF